MKKIMKKNQVIITSLAILIAVAGYLNFADVDLGFKDRETSTDSSSILDDVDYDLTYRCFGFCSTGKSQQGAGAFPEQSGPAGDHQ